MLPTSKSHRPGSLPKALRPGPSMAAVSASGAAALLLWALGGKDSLRLGVPKLTWEWDDPSAAPLERTKAGLANSLFPHRQCYELPSVRTVPFIGVLVMAAAIVSIKYAGAAHAIRRVCSIFVVYILGGVVDLPEIALAATVAVTTRHAAVELALWAPPIGALVLGASAGADLALVFVACVVAWLSAMSHAIDGRAEMFGVASAVFYVVAFCLFETFSGFSWVSPHC